MESPLDVGNTPFSLRELKLVSDLHSAIRHGGLHMNYQPKLDNHTGQLLQVEALVRWIHSELGFISPEEFIFLAGQINDPTDHILQRVANDARAWFNAGLDVGVAINLSAMDLTWPALTERITSIFAGWHHSMERITLEVTESALMEDPVEALATLNRLRDLGVTLSVDDFGTGYSSLSQLRKLPVQELKIDKSFVLRLNAEPQDQLIVKSTIDIAHGLGLTVVAEGIENLETWKLLQSRGCNVGQGFYLSRPVSAGDLAQTAAAMAGVGSRIWATGGVTTIEGSAGSGRAPWALLGSYASDEEWGGTIALSRAEVDDYTLSVTGAGLNRVEVSIARQTLDLDSLVFTLKNGFGLEQDELNQDFSGSKVFFAAVLGRNLLVNATVRGTRANQGGCWVLVAISIMAMNSWPKPEPACLLTANG